MFYVLVRCDVLWEGVSYLCRTKRESSPLSLRSQFYRFPRDGWNLLQGGTQQREIHGLVNDKDRKGKKFIRDYNQLNIPQQAIYPSEGSIILYPSNIPTGFFNAESSKESTHVIQGEIKLTLKPDILSTEDGLISINHWKKFNS